MLSLVNYDDSDESEKEEEEGDIKKQQSVEDSSKTADVQVAADGGTSTSTNGNSSDIQAQLLLTNASKDASSNKKTVKISIPSLKEFDDEPSSKKSKLFHGGTGLLNMLPAPKNASLTSSGRTPLLLPHVLNSKTSKSATAEKSESSLPKLPAKSESRPPVIPSTKPVDDNDEPDSVPDDKSNEIDFFGITQKNKEDETALSVSTQVDEQPGSSATVQQTWDANSTENAAFYGAQPDVPDVSNPQYAVYGGQIVYTQQSYDVQQEQQPAQDSLDDLLKDEGFLRLQGKKHRGKEDIQVIDVSADQQIMDAQEWVMKNLTEEKTYRPFRRRSEMPSSQHRRKHQITYLAFQAKERELELKNQWAQNRLTRRETQAKYGF